MSPPGVDCDDEAHVGDSRGDRDFVAVLGGDDVLGSALTAGMQAVGWSAARTSSWADLQTSGHAPTTAGFLLVATRGALPSGPPPHHLGNAPVLVLGRRSDAALLARGVDRGAAAAVCTDAPVHDVIARVDLLLRDPRSRADRTGAAARLRQHARDARLFATLTRREVDVLVEMLRGLPAVAIAEAHSVSLPTVRSHIASILSKLHVSSQLAAVALARRACDLPAVVGQVQQFHQF